MSSETTLWKELIFRPANIVVPFQMVLPNVVKGYPPTWKKKKKQKNQKQTTNPRSLDVVGGVTSKRWAPGGPLSPLPALFIFVPPPSTGPWSAYSGVVSSLFLCGFLPPLMSWHLFLLSKTVPWVIRLHRSMGKGYGREYLFLCFFTFFFLVPFPPFSDPFSLFCGGFFLILLFSLSPPCVVFFAIAGYPAFHSFAPFFPFLSVVPATLRLAWMHDTLFPYPVFSLSSGYFVLCSFFDNFREY